jgi:hypothetical protein
MYMVSMNDRFDYRAPSYPIVRFLVRKGQPIAIALATVPCAVGAYLGISAESLLYPLLGLIASVVVGGLLLSYVEVLRIISDTLIPR